LVGYRQVFALGRMRRRSPALRLVVVTLLGAGLAISPQASAAPGDIVTVAGNGAAGVSGDGGRARKAKLDAPAGLAFRSGNLYIADFKRHRVRKVSAGRITRVAGTGAAGFSGDGRAATRAKLNRPIGLAVDGAGGLYIGDARNHRVRRVNGPGRIATFAGTGVLGFSGEGGAARSANLSFPWELAFDAGNLYIADSGNHRVRRVDPSGTITTVAGTGVRGYSGDGGAATAARLKRPGAVAVDGSGRLYIADFGNNRVRRVDAAGKITTVAGNGVRGFSGDGGLARRAKLDSPSGLALDGSGNLYIADSANNRVRMVSRSGRISTVAGTGKDGFSGDGGKATKARINYPIGLAFGHPGNLYIADSGNHRVRMVKAVGR
jgi:sugar lactone lactonase YvrE